MTKTFETTWDMVPNNLLTNVPFAITNYIKQVALEQTPQFKELFPFNQQWESNGYIGDGWFAICIKELIGHQVPTIGSIKDESLIKILKEVAKLERFPSFNLIRSKLNNDGFNFEKFTYVGIIENSRLSWGHIQDVVLDWLNEIVLPIILERNRLRVLTAIPQPPQYNTKKILENIYILESEKRLSQGTCFHIKGIGFITCNHVLSDDLKIFSSADFNKKYPIEIISCNKDIDIAIISSNEFKLKEGLDLGTADNLEIMAHIAVSGFPNYRYGDTGIFSPGLIVGFRIVSGIRRILVNTPIISGNSGGPVVDKDGKVIGIAVTGTDKMENAGKTEDHGIIPIDALKYISSFN